MGFVTAHKGERPSFTGKHSADRGQWLGEMGSVNVYGERQPRARRRQIARWIQQKGAPMPKRKRRSRAKSELPKGAYRLPTGGYALESLGRRDKRGLRLTIVGV